MPIIMKNQRDIGYYLNLPYTFQVKRVVDEGKTYYWADVKELDGCHTSGDTWEQAYSELQGVFRTHLEIKLEYGDPIPEPLTDDYSGKFNLRIPKSLHRKLAERAELENVSLNQYCLYQLSYDNFNENEIFRYEDSKLIVNHTRFFDQLLLGKKWLFPQIYNIARQTISDGGKLIFIRKYTTDKYPIMKAKYETITELEDFAQKVKEYKLV